MWLFRCFCRVRHYVSTSLCQYGCARTRRPRTRLYWLWLRPESISMSLSALLRSYKKAVLSTYKKAVSVIAAVLGRPGVSDDGGLTSWNRRKGPGLKRNESVEDTTVKKGMREGLWERDPGGEASVNHLARCDARPSQPRASPANRDWRTGREHTKPLLRIKPTVKHFQPSWTKHVLTEDG